MSNKALLLVAHGSRRSSSNDEVRAVAKRLAEQDGGEYQQVRAAFLELAEPLIPQGIEQCIAEGAEEVVVLPYFLSAGRHVVEDIPAEAAKAEVGTARVRIAPYLGSAEGLEGVLLSLAAE